MTKTKSGLQQLLQHKTVWVLCLALCLSLLCLRPARPTAAQGGVNVCAVVNSYTAPSGLVPGSLSLQTPGGPITLVILPGANLDASLLVPNANVCVNLTAGLGGITGGTVSPGVTTTVNVCGIVTAVSANSVTINGQVIPIATGANISGQNLLQVGSNVCLNATLNVLGQISSGGVTANVGPNVSICGVVSAVSPTSVTIGGQVFNLVPGVTLNGQNLLQPGADVCLSATTNLAGQITGGGVTANVGANINICGVVTAVSPTSVTIAGQVLNIAPNVSLNGQNLLQAGANVCINATTNLAGQITGGGVTANVGANINVCGVVTAVSNGTVTIGGQTITIPANVSVAGRELLTVGNDVCLNLTTNVAGQVTGGGISLNITGSVNVCGTVTALVNASAGTPGSITIGGQTIVIAAGTNINGSVAVGQCVCITASTNSLGQIVGTLTITPSGTCAQPSPTPTPTPGVTPTPTPTPGVTPTPTPTPGTTPTPTPTPGATPTPTPGATPTPTPGTTPTPTPTPGTTPTPTPTPGTTPTPTPTPGTTPTPTPTPGGGGGPTPNPNCGAAQVIVPASTFGFTTTNNLPQGDLFLLSQRLFFTATTQPTDGLTVFPVTLGSFGGASFDLGGFRGADLSGIALSAPGATFRAVTCTDSLRDISFVLSATAGTSGDRVRLFTQDADGRNTRFLVEFTIDNGAARVTGIDSAVQLYLNSRLGAAGSAVALGGSVPLGLAAGTNGTRSGLLTLRLSQTTFTDCVRLGLEITRGSAAGQSAIVFTDVTVNRVEQAGDRASTSTGLLGGGTGGFPTGARCQSVCPACTTRCNVICLTSPQFFVVNPTLLPRIGSVFIGGINLNNPIPLTQGNLALILNFLQRDDSALDRLNQEYLALQLSILSAGGSLTTAAQLRSPLSCYGASGITPVTLSNGVVLTLNSSLADLLAQAALAARGNQTADQEALARLLDLVNGNELRRCARSTAAQ